MIQISHAIRARHSTDRFVQWRVVMTGVAQSTEGRMGENRMKAVSSHDHRGRGAEVRTNDHLPIAAPLADEDRVSLVVGFS